MILLRRFTGWATASSKIPSQRFHALGLRRRLLLAFLIVTGTIYGIAAALLYVFVSRSLNEQLNNQLLTLARAAAPSLEIVKTQGHKSLDKELPWRNLFANQEQNLEWFNAEGILLAREGINWSRATLQENLLPSCSAENSLVFRLHEQIRSVTVCVYGDTPDAKMLRLEGFMRASQSIQGVEATLNQLQLELGIAGVTLLSLIALSSIYLTQQTIEPISQSLQQLKQFTAEASHELRNPLARIVIVTELMLIQSEQFQASQIKKLEMIQDAAAQMQRLVEDLLFLARTDTTSFSENCQKTAVSLNNLLQALIGRFEPIVQSKGITLQTELLANLAVRGDASQLNRLFANLLENALKYTKSGGKVTLSLRKSKQSAIICVEDTGIGIAPELLPYIFHRFWRSERVRREQYEGMGLGLAIAQAIVQKHKGEIEVSSRLGVGSCFQVRLPLV